ncbi:MAG: ABC transporter permease [Deltaproteobacteria bacterium]
MSKKLINTGLLWKEWKENQLIFLLALVIMTWDTIWSPLLGLLTKGDPIYQLSSWGHDLNCLVYYNIYHSYDVMFLDYGMWVCLLLGVYILSRERRGSLEYLVTTPATRQEIITAKFLTGMTAILGIVLVEAAVMAWGGSHLAYTDYGIKEIGKWVFFTYPTLLAMFSIGLLAASLAGSIISSGFIAFFILILPALLNELFIILFEPLGRLLLRQPGSNAKITGSIMAHTSYLEDGFRSIASYLSIPDYLDRASRFPNLRNYTLNGYIYEIPDKILQHMTVLDPYYTFENLLLLAMICLIFFITVKAFTANSIEKKKLIIFPAIQNIALILISICLSQVVNWKLHSRGLFHTAPVYLLSLLLAALVIYTLLWLIICRYTNRSFIQTCRSVDWSRTARITGGGAAVVLLVALVVCAALPQLMLTTMKLGGLCRSAAPRLYEKPVTRHINENSPAQGDTIKCFNLSFSSPWETYLQVKREEDNINVHFSGEKAIRVYKYAHISNRIYWFTEAEGRTLRNLVYDDQSTPGYYAALSPILNSSPDQIRLFMPRQKAMKNLLQVVLKAEILENSGYPICHLTTSCIDGIQFPANVEEVPPGMVYADGPERASVTEFTDDHNQMYSIIIEGPHLKQSDVDRIISSVRFVE